MGMLALAVSLLAVVSRAGRMASRPPALELQPLAAQVARVTEALTYLGAPLADADRRAIDAALAGADERAAMARIQEVARSPLPARRPHQSREPRARDAGASARPELVEQGWRTFLVKVRNEAGVTAPLRVSSPQAQRVFARGRGGFSMSPTPEQTITARDVADRWLDLQAVRQAAARAGAVRPCRRIPDPSALQPRRRPARSVDRRRRRAGHAGHRLPQRCAGPVPRRAAPPTSRCASPTSAAGRRPRRS